MAQTEDKKGEDVCADTTVHGHAEIQATIAATDAHVEVQSGPAHTLLICREDALDLEEHASPRFERKVSPKRGSFFCEKTHGLLPDSPDRAASQHDASPLRELNANGSNALDLPAVPLEHRTGFLGEPSRPRQPQEAKSVTESAARVRLLKRSNSESVLTRAEKENPGCMSEQAVLKLYDRLSTSARSELALLAKIEAWNIPRHKIMLGRELGRGAGGVVYLARWCGLQVAAKTLHCQNAVQRRYDPMHAAQEGIARKDLLNEVAVLSHLRHPNLVLFLGACIGGDEIFILSEYIEHGNLEQHVASAKGAQACCSLPIEARQAFRRAAHSCW